MGEGLDRPHKGGKQRWGWQPQKGCSPDFQGMPLLLQEEAIGDKERRGLAIEARGAIAPRIRDVG